MTIPESVVCNSSIWHRYGTTSQLKHTCLHQWRLQITTKETPISLGGDDFHLFPIIFESFCLNPPALAALTLSMDIKQKGNPIFWNLLFVFMRNIPQALPNTRWFTHEPQPAGAFLDLPKIIMHHHSKRGKHYFPGMWTIFLVQIFLYNDYIKQMQMWKH